LNAETDQFLAFVLLERRRHSQRLYLASLVASLITVLLYQTQWLYLRSGLIVLLAGQVGDVLALLFRRLQLSNDLPEKKSGIVNEVALTGWFEREESFVRHLAFFDAACQVIGFSALGFAFWISTHSLWLALLIGVVYPLTSYFGINRRKKTGTIKELRAKRRELAGL